LLKFQRRESAYFRTSRRREWRAHHLLARQFDRAKDAIARRQPAIRKGSGRRTSDAACPSSVERDWKSKG